MSSENRGDNKDIPHMNRRKALGTIGKAVAIAGGIVVVGGAAAYVAAQAAAPPPTTVVTTVTQPTTTVTTVTKPTTVVSTITQPTTTVTTVTKPTTFVTTVTQPTTTVTTVTQPTTVVTTVVEKPKGYFWGDSPYEMIEPWYWTLNRAALYYASYLGDKIITIDPHMNLEPQIKDIRYMMQLKVDGLMVAPTSAEGIVDVLEEAHDQGLPIVTYDADANTPVVGISIRVDSFRMGKQLAEKFVEMIKADGKELEGTVFMVHDRPGNVIQVARKDGMLSVLNQYPGLEVIEFTAFSRTEKAKEVIMEATRAYGKPFIVMATNLTQLIGVVEGLKAVDLAIPRGKEGHVYVAGVDAGPTVLTMLKEGLIDVAIDQPNLFYGALAIKFLRLIKEKGEEALPSVGTTVISDPKKPEGPQPDGTYNIFIEDIEVKGVRPFQFPFWAPCPVAEHQGHRWLQLNSALVTAENADTIPIWSNVVKPWFEE